MDNKYIVCEFMMWGQECRTIFYSENSDPAQALRWLDSMMSKGWLLPKRLYDLQGTFDYKDSVLCHKIDPDYPIDDEMDNDDTE